MLAAATAVDTSQRTSLPPRVAEIALNYDQGGALRAPRAGTSAGLRPWEAPADARRPSRPGRRRSCQANPQCIGELLAAALLGASSVQLPAVASRSLPAVASHAIGFVEPRLGARSHRSGRLARKTGKEKSSRSGRWAAVALQAYMALGRLWRDPGKMSKTAACHARPGQGDSRAIAVDLMLPLPASTIYHRFLNPPQCSGKLGRYFVDAVSRSEVMDHHRLKFCFSKLPVHP